MCGTNATDLRGWLVANRPRALARAQICGTCQPSFRLGVQLYPDEIPRESSFWEGAAHRVSVNAFERDERARAACIEHFGPTCRACAFSFADQYGTAMAGFIHVHHSERW